MVDHASIVTLKRPAKSASPITWPGQPIGAPIPETGQSPARIALQKSHLTSNRLCFFELPSGRSSHDS